MKVVAAAGEARKIAEAGGKKEDLWQMMLSGVKSEFASREGLSVVVFL